jgi:hypothetical protein
MPLHVVFKGPAKAAKRAAARAGFPIAKCKKVGKWANEVSCNAPCAALEKIQRVYGRISIKRGRGASPGDILLFSYGSCPTERRGAVLHGARRRRRRRRR